VAGAEGGRLNEPANASVCAVGGAE
jgi:hypothetical protein